MKPDRFERYNQPAKSSPVLLYGSARLARILLTRVPYSVINRQTDSKVKVATTTMTDSDLKLFQQAVTLARKPEQRPAAYARLKQLEIKYPSDMFILIWLAYTRLSSDPTLVEAETALAKASQVTANPGDEALLDAYDWLASQRQLRYQKPGR